MVNERSISSRVRCNCPTCRLSSRIAQVRFQGSVKEKDDLIDHLLRALQKAQERNSEESYGVAHPL